MSDNTHTIKKRKGRPKGSANKLTATLKEAIEASFSQIGGVRYLVRMAEEEPKAYMALLGKILPKDINATIEGLTVERIMQEHGWTEQSETKVH